MSTFVRQGHEDVKFFIGPEVEQSPAFCKKTLFVVGLQELSVIEGLAREHKTPHIFLSANRSFDGLELSDKGVYQVVSSTGTTTASAWEVQIRTLLDKGFMVSLDYPAHKHEMVLKVLGSGIWQSRNFVPILSVAIPHVNTSSKNLTIKIDDNNFKATNPGVWCMHYTEVTDSNRFTDWQEYGDDEIVSEENIQKYSKTITTLPLKVAAPPIPANPVSEVDPIGIGAAEDEKATPMPPIVSAPVAPVEKIKLSDLKPLNDAEAGLDPHGKSQLKQDAEETKTETTISNPRSAAEAYADGATQDPLGKDSSSKPAGKKA